MEASKPLKSQNNIKNAFKHWVWLLIHMVEQATDVFSMASCTGHNDVSTPEVEGAFWCLCGRWKDVENKRIDDNAWGLLSDVDSSSGACIWW